MKKLLCIVIAIATLLLLTSCGKKNYTAEDFKDVTLVIGDESAYLYANADTGYSDYRDGTFNYDKWKSKSKLDIECKKIDSHDDKMLKILAMDTDVDIYYLGQEDARLLKEMGALKPIDSKIIDSYASDCFDVLDDFCRNENGQVIMLPISYYVDGVFVPKIVVEELGLKAEDIEYLDGYLEWVYANMTDERPAIHIPYTLFDEIDSQYDMYYNDFPNKRFDYNTEVYKEMCRKLLDGWDVGKEYYDFWPPYAQNFSMKMNPHHSRTLCVLGTFGSINFKLNGFNMNWDVFPMPKLDENCEAPLAAAQFVIINPSSENPEAATLALETLAQNLFSLQGGNGGSRWVFKNMERYPESVDTQSDIFEQFIQLGLKSQLYNKGSAPSVHTYVDDYTMGKISLDELIAEKMRVVEIWLYE